MCQAPLMTLHALPTYAIDASPETQATVPDKPFKCEKTQPTPRPPPPQKEKTHHTPEIRRRKTGASSARKTRQQPAEAGGPPEKKKKSLVARQNRGSTRDRGALSKRPTRVVGRAEISRAASAPALAGYPPSHHQRPSLCVPARLLRRDSGRGHHGGQGRHHTTGWISSPGQRGGKKKKKKIHST